MKSTAVKLTKIKQFYFPVDADDYKLLKSFGLPVIKIHENLLPTLGLVFNKHKIKPQSVNFMDTIMNPYLDKIGEVWQSKEHRVATITKSVMKFETTKASIQASSREALHKLETSLRRFFTRWGYSAVFELSESRGKLKLHVQYKFDPERDPIIPLVEDATSLPSIKLELGFVRLSLTLMKREVEINVAIAAGTGWNSIHTSRCLYSQITDVRPMLTALVNVVNNDQHNSDNKAK
jgi:hypothetical protein